MTGTYRSQVRTHGLCSAGYNQIRISNVASMKISDELRNKLAVLQSLRREAVATDNPITANRLRMNFREESCRFLDYLESEIG